MSKSANPLPRFEKVIMCGDLGLISSSCCFAAGFAHIHRYAVHTYVDILTYGSVPLRSLHALKRKWVASRLAFKATPTIASFAGRVPPFVYLTASFSHAEASLSRERGARKPPPYSSRFMKRAKEKRGRCLGKLLVIWNKHVIWHPIR